MHLVTTDHMGSTCAHHYPHTKFHQFSPLQNSGYLIFFVISQSEQICKWGIKYVHLVKRDHKGSTCAHHYPYTKFKENRSLCSHLRVKVYLPMLIHPSICTHMQTALQMKTKWSFQHSWRPTKKSPFLKKYFRF